MSDRLTQLQDAVNQLAEHFCNGVGILQQSAVPGSFAGLEKSGSKEPAVTNDDTIRLFSTLITKTAKDIDVLIDSLPSEESTPELQAKYLAKLEQENQDAAARLRTFVDKGEEQLAEIQKALVEIAQAQLQARSIEANVVCGINPTTSIPREDEITGDFSDLPQR
ncbi:mediator of RNA polymerase II transcription subunit 21-like [Ciona intestinalis]|uniref:Mediator of RNA polymerase II transcription subunit 21 n=1 Tax=Ciona intestinalis TaxID=7719 RepID=H2XU70_CIOIN|nr:mediator of RNA polymerase II transcription subunit 21-like [Ciona intestinalis]|eukprot:XP_002128572.1 mediator of RNA polymerase II transcription subunit 21-like [Ciona intestinalis]